MQSTRSGSKLLPGASKRTARGACVNSSVGPSGAQIIDIYLRDVTDIQFDLDGRLMKRVLLLAVLLAPGSSAIAQNTPAGMTPAEAKKAEAYFHFSMARVLDQEQAFDDSIKEYRKALEVTPNDAEIYS